MSQITSTLMALQKPTPRAALIPFLTAGFPTPEDTVPLLHAMAEAGADLIEVGMPFSDPMADGPIIEAAGHKALAQGINVAQIFSMIKTFRERNTTTPIVLMGYANPIEAMGYEHFAEQCRQCSVDGVLVVDLPPEEAKEFATLLRARHIDLICLISPTTPSERVKTIAQNASGYLYVVSLKGVTGSSALDMESVRHSVNGIRNATDLPIAVGFGIGHADQAKQIGTFADGVIIGSRLIALLDESHQAHQNAADRQEHLIATAQQFLRPIKSGLMS